MISPEELTIGTDPELLCVDGDNNVPINVRDYYSVKDPFGADGHPYLAELRPKAASCPRELTANVRKTLMLGFDKLGFAQWKVSPWELEKPMGGHIHYGIGYEPRFLHALDSQLAIVLGLIEPPEQATLRRTKLLRNPDNGWVAGHPYGMLGDMREKPWGFEYRTPSTFIASPGVTIGMLAIAKAIVFEELTGGKFAWSNLSAKQKSELAFTKKDFIAMNKPVFTKLGDILMPMVAGMNYFQTKEGKPLWSIVTYLLKQVSKYKGYYLYKDVKRKWNISEQTVSKELKALKDEPGEFRINIAQPNLNDLLAQDPGAAAQLRLPVEEIRLARFRTLNQIWREL